jgi:peroxiredoxin
VNADALDCARPVGKRQTFSAARNGCSSRVVDQVDLWRSRQLSSTVEEHLRIFEITRESMMMRPAIFMVALLATAGSAFGGKYNEVLNIGDRAPEWSELEGVDGRRHSTSDLANKDVVVVVFTCNSCPVATDYEDRIIAFAKKYATSDGKVALVAINVNKVPEDLLPKMRERAEAKGFLNLFPYLYDESQQIGKAFGAEFTPEFFVLNRQRQVVYMGGMDDNSRADEVKTNYLEPAIEAALSGKTPKVAEAPAIGCRVRYERARRTKADKK